MEEDDEFSTVHSTHAGETKAILKELCSDNKWKFRIKAVNKVGAGESSDSTDFILIQDDRGMKRYNDLYTKSTRGGLGCSTHFVCISIVTTNAVFKTRAKC